MPRSNLVTPLGFYTTTTTVVSPILFWGNGGILNHCVSTLMQMHHVQVVARATVYHCISDGTHMPHDDEIGKTIL